MKKELFGLLFGCAGKSNIIREKYNWYLKLGYSEKEAREKAEWHTR